MSQLALLCFSQRVLEELAARNRFSSAGISVRAFDFHTTLSFLAPGGAGCRRGDCFGRFTGDEFSLCLGVVEVSHRAELLDQDAQLSLKIFDYPGHLRADLARALPGKIHVPAITHRTTRNICPKG